VAFCTQNVVPGIDFTNDPLLQGRNFSYLDTQVKRLGGPNFSQLPVNAPKCPFHHFQQDGHMAFNRQHGRANYEPNSWSGEAAGPRESPEQGFRSHPTQEDGCKRRVRAESFADHYSQARQFYRSQTEVEQRHIAAAFQFELSKVETAAIRARVVSHLRNVDQDLAQQVSDGLRLKEMPDAADAARPTREDLAESPALSILRNGPSSFKGRKVGVLVTDGVDADRLDALLAAVKEEGAMSALVAPAIGGVELSDGRWLQADEKIDGGPSVLFDAVALMVSTQGADMLKAEPTARDFVTDAFAHLKFIGYDPAAMPLLEKAGVAGEMDDGLVEIAEPAAAERFVLACRKLRHWARESAIQQ
jgi:catalase